MKKSLSSIFIPTKAIPIDVIEVKENIRSEMDKQKFEETLESIREFGLLQPIAVVRTTGTLSFDVVFGHRRLKACKELGWDLIEAKIYPEGTTSLQILLLQIEENDKRENVSTFDNEQSIMKLIKKEGLKQVEVARLLKKHPSDISKIVKATKIRATLRKMGLPPEYSALPTSTLSDLNKLSNEDMKEILDIAFEAKRTSQENVRNIKAEYLEQKKRDSMPVAIPVKKKPAKKKAPSKKKIEIDEKLLAQIWDNKHESDKIFLIIEKATGKTPNDLLKKYEKDLYE